MFTKLKTGISKSVATVNVASNVYLETNKIKLMIENTQSSIEEIIRELGWTAYRSMESGNLNQDELRSYIGTVNEKKAEITRLLARIQELEAEKQMVLGSQKESEGTCSQCGENNPPEAAFCRKCGRKLT